ncbi:MAG TPA: hypothetical protein PKN56_18265 [Leptospiraceae bacterium]|nr:hypothetical protein [Leptospiraceae bacterium]
MFLPKRGLPDNLLNRMRRFFSLLLLSVLSFHCSNSKTEIADKDMESVLEKFAMYRFHQSLEMEDPDMRPSDRKILQEICSQYRYSCPKVLEKIKSKYPILSKRLENEK